MAGESSTSDGPLPHSPLWTRIDETGAQRPGDEAAWLAQLTADVALAVTRSGCLGEMLPQCAAAIVANIEATFVRIWTLNESNNCLELTTSAGLDPGLSICDSDTLSEQFLTELRHLERQSQFQLDDLREPPNGDGKWTKLENAIAFSGDPLLVNGHLIGALALFSRKPLSVLARKALGTVADSIALGIERHRMNAAFIELEERFRTVVEFVPDAMVVVDQRGHIMLVNAQVENLFGYQRRELLGEPMECLLPERLREAHVARRNQFFAAPHLRAICDAPNLLARRKDGSECPVEISLSPLKTDRFTLFAANIRDVTEHRQAEQERARLLDIVEHQRTELQMILDSVPALIFYKDRQGRLVRVNAAHAQCFRLLREQIEGKPDVELGAPFASRHVLDDLQVMTTGEPLRGQIEQFQTPTGLRWLQTEKVPHRNVHGNIVGLVGIAVDITERKHLEEQLRQSQKMEAVGRLACGVAHDFNNLLTVINGYCELLLDNEDHDDLRRPVLQEIKQAGERAARLTHQLLAFSRKQVLEPRVLDLNQQVANLEKMLRRLIGEDVHFRTELEPNLWPVLADVGQLEQVIMNLTINARDAMPEGGALTIRTSNVDVRERDVTHPPVVQPGCYVVLSVTDTGHGMDEKTCARIFEPFFTTKVEGKGTGLGLAVVFGIVKQSGGHIDVQSEPGRGTTFSIYFPWSQRPETPLEPRPNAQRFPFGSETILLVEDESSLRQLASQTLRNYGYTVLEASNGSDGLQIGAAHLDSIHLLITDVIMPVLCGRKLVEQLVQERPALKVLYVSGCTADAITEHGAAIPGTGFLQKPFTPATLSQKVREVLDQPRSAS